MFLIPFCVLVDLRLLGNVLFRTPLPAVCQSKDFQDVRPLSVTSILYRLLERLVCVEIPHSGLTQTAVQ